MFLYLLEIAFEFGPPVYAVTRTDAMSAPQYHKATPSSNSEPFR